MDLEKGKREFANILGSDEEIIEVFKPNKFRYLILNIIFRSIGGIIVGLLSILAGLFIQFTDTDEAGNVIAGSEHNELGLVIFGVIVLAFVFITILPSIISYSKRWYCYTTKRVIIRSGVIGADYQCLDYELIGGISVNVGLLDKFCHPNTGFISFASAAGPVVQNFKGVSGYCFMAISDPYAVYKRIKEYYDNYKANKK